MIKYKQCIYASFFMFYVFVVVWIFNWYLMILNVLCSHETCRCSNFFSQWTDVWFLCFYDILFVFSPLFYLWNVHLLIFHSISPLSLTNFPIIVLEFFHIFVCVGNSCDFLCLWGFFQSQTVSVGISNWTQSILSSSIHFLCVLEPTLFFFSVFLYV